MLYGKKMESFTTERGALTDANITLNRGSDQIS
jgi:hypothetical protein